MFDRGLAAPYRNVVDTFAAGTEETLHQRLVDLESVLASTRESLVSTAESLTASLASLATVTEERDRLRRAYALLKEHFELLRRQIFAARAERIDTHQLEIEFAETKAKMDAVEKQVDAAEAADAAAAAAAAQVPPLSPPPPPPPDSPECPTRTGRRNLCAEEMIETRIEILDPELEGRVPRIGFEDSYRLGYRRGGPIRVRVARGTYKHEVEDLAADAAPGDAFVTTPMPREMLDRGLLAPSLIAHLLVSKYRFGLPFHRLVEMLRAQDVRLDDGTMCRYAEHVGATLGCIVEACATEAMESAFCLSTDATGVAIQPTAIPGKRQACRKGHFFVVLADQDHIFFEFQREHTSDAVCQMFKGFKGYIQADAHAVYNALYRGEALDDPDDKAPDEVGCWAHARRRFFDAAIISKNRDAQDALLRIQALFLLEQRWAKLAPKQRHAQRQLYTRPILDELFAWFELVFERVKGVRSLVATAFGYAVRQKDALCRFLDDGRLPMTNNHSERALRPIAVGRKMWLFFGSDDHAAAAANLFSLIASCRLHHLDAETYLAEMIRIVPLWPSDRYLELAPKYWARTRARLVPNELENELGPITVPPLLPATAADATQEPTPD